MRWNCKKIQRRRIQRGRKSDPFHISSKHITQQQFSCTCKLPISQSSSHGQNLVSWQRINSKPMSTLNAGMNAGNFVKFSRTAYFFASVWTSFPHSNGWTFVCLVWFFALDRHFTNSVKRNSINSPMVRMLAPRSKPIIPPISAESNNWSYYIQ